jgi:hypothetical protein
MDNFHIARMRWLALRRVFDSIQLIGEQGGACPSMLAPILIDSPIVLPVASPPSGS